MSWAIRKKSRRSDRTTARFQRTKANASVWYWDCCTRWIGDYTILLWGSSLSGSIFKNPNRCFGQKFFGAWRKTGLFTRFFSRQSQEHFLPLRPMHWFGLWNSAVSQCCAHYRGISCFLCLKGGISRAEIYLAEWVSVLTVLDGLAFVKSHSGSADETSANFRKAMVWSGLFCVGLAVFFAIGYVAITLGDIWFLTFYARLSGLA